MSSAGSKKMPSYEVFLKPSVEKDLRALPRSAIARIWGRFETLRHDPLPRQSVKLEGAQRLYRIRVGVYRIIYEVDKEAREVTIHYVRHRKDAYRAM
jgi:mRNA interferase RelE/StbE